MSLLHSIAEFFNEGGWTMYITASVGVVGLAITFERSLKLYFKFRHNAPLFMSRIKELLLQNRVEDAIQYCNLEKEYPLPKVVKAGLERMGCDENIVRQSMESSYLDVSPKITQRVPYLGLLANGGLLFGLLGTVLGLIRQFQALGSADAADKQLMMARGIAEAMNNTALGLMVALPLLIIHGVISSRANELMEEVESGSAQFIDWIGLYNYGQLEERLQSSDPTADRRTKLSA